MAYSPLLSNQSSCTLRRMAWALEIPMTQAAESIIVYMAKRIDSSIVCKKCQDKSKCNLCDFHSKSKNQKKKRNRRGG